jgi:hypothetical protein
VVAADRAGIVGIACNAVIRRCDVNALYQLRSVWKTFFTGVRFAIYGHKMANAVTGPGAQRGRRPDGAPGFRPRPRRRRRGCGCAARCAQARPAVPEGVTVLERSSSLGGPRRSSSGLSRSASGSPPKRAAPCTVTSRPSTSTAHHSPLPPGPLTRSWICLVVWEGLSPVAASGWNPQLARALRRKTSGSR